MSQQKKTPCRREPASQLHRTALAAALSALVCGPALAFEIDTGNADLSLRWDNTVRLNYGVRTQNRDPKIASSALADEGDYLFNKGQAVTERIDLLSEFDLVYKRDQGLRLSATAWYDGAYSNASKSNPALATIPSYVNNQFSSTVKRFYEGPSAEFLDAFAFGAVDLGAVPVRFKLGRHTIYWGESLMLGGHVHSVSYAQSPLDLQKAFATPGTEVKELFRPLNQLSMQAQLRDDLSISAQYLLQWQAARYIEGGTYLGPVDFVFDGPDRQFLSAGLGFATRGPASAPPQRGEWGLSARWSPSALDATLGFYYRKFADKLPQVFLTKAAPNASVYDNIYADHIDLFGVSMAKNVNGVSIGAEASMRRNTPLNSKVLGVAPGMPAPGETAGPRGDTLHALVNFVGVIPQTALFDTASWAVEAQYSHWTKIRSGQNLFNATGFAPCVGKDKWDGCATKNYSGISLAFTPTWFQVLPGVDLSVPYTYAMGIDGNAAVTFGGNQGLGNYTIGLGADVRQRFRFDLKYIQYIGHIKDNGTTVTSTNGLSTYLRDRGFVALTFKTTF
ncbi:MAG: DUF1302 domain-containing protein [Burkholderiales bacterium]|nr:DUF1302 domain-containing protein [Burkholderiales bacterium]